MNQPPLDKLIEKVDSRYTLVVVAAKRARIINESNKNENGLKPVTEALHEIANGKVKYSQPKQGRK